MIDVLIAQLLSLSRSLRLAAEGLANAIVMLPAIPSNRRSPQPERP